MIVTLGAFETVCFVICILLTFMPLFFKKDKDLLWQVIQLVLVVFILMAEMLTSVIKSF